MSGPPSTFFTHISNSAHNIQPRTTIGFGDYPVFTSTFSRNYTWIAFPFFLFGWALFPVWLITLFNVIQDAIVYIFPSKIELHRFQGGLEMSRKSVYRSYDADVKQAMKTMRQLSLVNNSGEVIDEQAEEDSNGGYIPDSGGLVWIDNSGWKSESQLPKLSDSELEDVKTPDILHKSHESNNLQVPHHAKRVDIETIEKVGPIPKNTEKSTGIVDINSNTYEI